MSRKLSSDLRGCVSAVISSLTPHHLNGEERFDELNNLDVLRAGLEFADFGGGGAKFVESGDGIGEVIRVNNKDHADAHVKSAAHFGFGDVAQCLDGFKYGQGCPGATVDFCLDIEGEDTREIIVESTAGDVGDGFDRPGLQEWEDAIEIAGVGA